jgi:hypothetical protein
MLTHDKSSHGLRPGELKTDRHDITKILLKVALNTITLTLFNCLLVDVLRIKIPLFTAKEILEAYKEC